jgi:hypothetical protein
LEDVLIQSGILSYFRSVTCGTFVLRSASNEGGTSGNWALEVLLITASAAAVLLATVVVVLDSFADDADAQGTTRLKTLWAVVNPDGTLAREKGATSSRKASTGEYEIRFVQDVRSCAYSATFDHSSGFVFIALRDDSIGQRVVGVTTSDRGGTVRDSPFHLVVHC